MKAILGTLEREGSTTHTPLQLASHNLGTLEAIVAAQDLPESQETYIF